MFFYFKDLRLLKNQKGDDKSFVFGKKYPVHIVDRVGGGDAFSAGIIYGNIQNFTAKDTLDFAVASSALAHTIHGDLNLVSISEVESVAKGDTTVSYTHLTLPTKA